MDLGRKLSKMIDDKVLLYIEIVLEGGQKERIKGFSYFYLKGN